ncbi:MAG: FAD-binding and (Fe-S)-binding domain-containing protein [Ignavibacteriales bacterium]|nr:FAD-binding and (Fe-S)-binding domain-containing protein [Ignavibacteriales bacterium]
MKKLSPAQTLPAPYNEFYERISISIPADRLVIDDLRTLAYGTDAGFYRLIPKIVVQAESEDDVISILRLAHALHLPVTFRAAGTSLSGQAISDSVLITLGSGWKKCSITQDASAITLQPGVIGAYANARLAGFGKKIGPDPASINSAMIGGIAANNASGMCCGTSQNSYRTLAGMKVILHDGTLLNTLDPRSREQFALSHPQMIEQLAALAESVRAHIPLAARIRQKYTMKNTTGYSLNALVDYTDPIDILQHLMIGSEGTLGFIAEITYRTVPELPHKTSSLMIFPDIASACSAVPVLKRCLVDACEIMDRAALRSVENKPGMPEYLRTLDANAAALLVETRAEDPVILGAGIKNILDAMKMFPQVIPFEFTTITGEYTKLWDIRKGLFPSVGAMRASGTTCIIEDVAFPLPRLAEATLDLQRLFLKHGYHDAIIFGHALEGNLHFVFNQDFNSAEEIQRYAGFIDDVTALVVDKYDGSLKAEHGTGRNMAPFVEMEWGTEAYDLMKKIKRLFDPESLLNPGVILNSDPKVHLASLKPLPAADEIVDKCIECGFCEVHCPSRGLTLTPRQRIVVFREMSRLRASGENPERLQIFEKDFPYQADETCATDGLCATACPVGIDTGKMIKTLRFRSHSGFAHGVAGLVAANMHLVTDVMRLMLSFVDWLHRLVGTEFFGRNTLALRSLSGNLIPLWNRYMPKGADLVKPPLAALPDSAPEVVYFPTCINRTMGVADGDKYEDSLVTRTQSFLIKAGFRVLYPDRLSTLCCGMAFDSKGFKEEGMMKSSELEAALLAVSENGRIPVYCDMSPCLYRMKQVLDPRLQLFEPVEFMLRYAVDRLVFTKVPGTIAIHSTCSSEKMGLTGELKRLAAMCAANVILPEEIECCGWAGDRGFTYPELNTNALKDLQRQLPPDCRQGYSTSRTCEIGLSLHSGIHYQSIVYLVDECTMAK